VGDRGRGAILEEVEEPPDGLGGGSPRRHLVRVIFSSKIIGPHNRYSYALTPPPPYV